jgi:phosphatidate cytidylyltransferase
VGELRKRVLAAICLAPLTAFLFYILPPKWLFLFLITIVVIAASEFVTMAAMSKKPLILFLIAASLIPILYRSFHGYLLWLVFSPVVYLVVELAGGGNKKENLNSEIVRTVSGLLLGQLFIALPFFYVYLLKVLNPYLPLILLFSVWSSDTCAYFAGKTFGKTPLVPRISPKKTCEGLAGAVFGSMLIMGLTFILSEMGLIKSLLVGAMIGLLGQLGDIFESVGKRVAGVKDSSGLIPGHGGVLDRMDSFIFTAPFLYTCAAWQA